MCVQHQAMQETKCVLNTSIHVNHMTCKQYETVHVGDDLK